MKKTIIIGIFGLSLSNQINSQVLDYNNVSAHLGTNGILFNNTNSPFHTAGYEIPKLSGAKAIFASSLWCGALDSQGALHLAAMEYGQNGQDFFSGPFSSTNSYANLAYSNAYGSSMWQVTRSEITNHIANYASSGYIIPNGILTWPGNGISGVGVATNLAPFVDMNNNGVYEPILGDYPDIRGDEAFYTIMNDSKNVHSETGGEIMGIEVHTMIYQYASNDYRNNTTFLNYRIFNRGVINYPQFKLGIYWDSDLGYFIDDYVGCDTSQNLMYVYNGDFDDETAGNNIGYGVNPPAVGVQSLNQKMSSFTMFSSLGSSFPYNDPSSAPQYYQIMDGKWADGSPKYFGGNGSLGSTGATSQITNYLFPGNPNISSEWSEFSVDGAGSANVPSDRRGVMTMEEENLPPGATVCYDFAILYAREPGNNNLQNVNSLISLAATAKTDFDAMTTYNCNLYTASLDQLDENQIGLYPNPSNGNFTLSLGEFLSGEIQITDLTGRNVLFQEFTNQNNVLVRLTEVNGIFHLKLTTDKGTVNKKINIQE